MIKKSYKITSEKGLHARTATELVKQASYFICDIYLTVGKITVDFKSIMGVMSIGAYTGEILNLEFNGSDESEAEYAISLLISSLKLGKEI